MEKTSPRDEAFAANEPPLPAERAFVVQLRAEADAAGNPIVGRVEHLASGAVTQFTSAADLIAFITQAVPPRHTPVGSGPLPTS